MFVLIFCSLQLNIREGDWLRNSAHNPQHDNILLIHGYAGGDNLLPTVVLRDGELVICDKEVKRWRRSDDGNFNDLVVECECANW